jgi:hypothetical protein
MNPAPQQLFSADTIPLMKLQGVGHHAKADHSGPLLFYNAESGQWQIRDSSSALHQGTLSGSEKQVSPLIIIPVKKPRETYNPETGSHIVFSGDWIIGVLLISVIIVAWARSFYNKALVQTVQAVWDYKVSVKMYREKNTLSQRVSFMLTLVFLLNASLLAYELLWYYHVGLPGVPDFVFFLLVTLLLMFLYGFKLFVYILLGNIFQAEKETQEFLHNINIYYRTFGLVIFPWVTGIPFMPAAYTSGLVWSGLGVVGLFILAQVIRGFLYGMKINIALFYMFLYLCTLEILPVILIYKIFKLLI